MLQSSSCLPRASFASGLAARLVVLILLGLMSVAAATAQTPVAVAIAHPNRPGADRLRDATRKPVEVLEFFGIEAGMHVLDIFGGGGWYAEILNYLVGPEGSVLLYNNRAWEGYAGGSLNRRLADERLPRVRLVTEDADSVDFGAEVFDAAVFILGFHDLYYTAAEWQQIDVERFLQQIYRSLKPGAVLGIVDHVGAEGSGTSQAREQHRIEPVRIVSDLEAVGFVFEAESPVLRNPRDRHVVSVNNPAVRGRTDRVVMRFRKLSSR